MSVKEYNENFYPKFNQAVSFINGLNHALEKCDENSIKQMECIGYDEYTIALISEALETYKEAIKQRETKMRCPYCETDTNDFILANQTADYSGIEMAINRQGIFRVRTYPNSTDDSFDLQDVVELKYCPLCGKPFVK